MGNATGDVMPMPSNLPSRFSKPGAAPPSQPSSQPYSAPSQPASSPDSSPGSILPLFLAVMALAISLASFYGAFFMEHPLSPAQKTTLAGIADDLRTLQSREVTMTAPVQTTIYLNKSYPIKDLFPANFDMPLEFEIPIDTQMIAIGSTGQPMTFRVQESVPIKVTVQISSAKAFGSNTIQINKELPVEATFTSSVKVRSAFGRDLNEIISKLDSLAGEPDSAG